MPPVKIGPFVFPLRWVDELPKNERGKSLWGKIELHGEEVGITVWRSVTADRALAIFLHEVVHGVDHAWSVKLSERQIERLGVGLATVLLDNDMLSEAWFQAFVASAEKKEDDDASQE